MQCLVTGGTGFIGAHLVHSLLAEGHRVRALVRPESDTSVLRSGGIEIVRADLLSGAGVLEALQGIDVIFHLAAPRRSFNSSTGRLERSDNENMIGRGITTLVAAMDHAQSARLILASSVTVYSDAIQLPVSEDAFTNPSDTYGKARLDAERIVRTLHRGRPGRYVIARLTGVYGAGDRQHQPLFRDIAKGTFRLIGSGDHIHHVSFVDDVVRGLVACARSDLAAGETLNIGSPATSLRSFLSAVASAAGVQLRTTPMLKGPARIALSVLDRIELATGKGAQLRSVLDYQMRPRHFDLSRSRVCLGDYGWILPERGVPACLNWYLEGEPS